VTSKRTCYARCGLVSTTNVVCLRQHIDINVSLLQGNKISAHKSVSFMHLLQQCETLQSLLLDIMNTPAKCNSSTKAVATAQCQTAELAGQSSLLMQRWQGSLIRCIGTSESQSSPRGPGNWSKPQGVVNMPCQTLRRERPTPSSVWTGTSGCFQ
jgi:hypothetical protein